MKKNQKVEKSSETQAFEKYFDELLKEMEADNEYVNYTIPEDWDREFRAAIKEGLREQRKRVWKLRIRRITKVAGVVTVIVLLICTSNFTVEETQGKEHLNFFQSIFDIGNDQHVTYGTDENLPIDFSDKENDDILFKGKTLDEIFSRIRSELKTPMFYFDDVFEEYEIKETKYSKDFHVLYIEIETTNGSIYVTQQDSFDETGSGITSNKEECAKINNENLDQEITIYKNKSADGYLFSVTEEYMLLSLTGNISLKKCEDLAKSLYYE